MSLYTDTGKHVNVPDDITLDRCKVLLDSAAGRAAEVSAEVTERVVVLEGLLRDVEMPQTVRKAVLHHLQRMMLAVSR